MPRVLMQLVMMISALMLSGQSRAADPHRVALVIGNSSYRFVAPLANSGSDAKLIATTLTKDGFTLVGGRAQIDLDKTEFENLIQKFGKQIEGASVAVFYYAGHGLQISGLNYLVPIGANPVREADADFQLIGVSQILHQMRDASATLNIVILDACRNNPFSGRGLRALSGGLAQMQAPAGTFISYATQPGNVAQDGSDGNGPYAKALAAAMQQPGLDLFQVFNQTGLHVADLTGGEQQPWMSNSPISGQFFFVPPGSTVTIQTPPPTPDPETTFWQSVRDSADVRALEAYLQQYPSGRFAALAQLRIAALRPSALPAAPQPNGPAGEATWQGRSFRRFTVPESDVLVAFYPHWNSLCQPLGLPMITVLTKPMHGTVDIRPETKTIDWISRMGGTDCRGHTLPGFSVWYKPSDFHGMDEFDYQIHYPEATLHDRAVISVR